MHSAFPRHLLNSPKNAKVPGGSVSRRVHAHLQRTRTTPPQGEPSQPNPTNSNPSRSSGERGLGGEGLLSEKPPLPPEFPIHCLFGREREGGYFSSEKYPPSQLFKYPLCFFQRVDGVGGEGRGLMGGGKPDAV